MAFGVNVNRHNRWLKSLRLACYVEGMLMEKHVLCKVSVISPASLIEKRRKQGGSSKVIWFVPIRMCHPLLDRFVPVMMSGCKLLWMLDKERARIKVGNGRG